MNFDEISQKIRLNLNSINKLLSECSIESKFATDETKEKFEKVFSINHEEIASKTISDEYCDLDMVYLVFNMLDSAKTTDNHSRKLKRIESVSSISSATTEESSTDNMTEIIQNLNQMAQILDNIKNTRIDPANIDAMSEEESSKNNKFLELVLNLQKLARDLTNIAATDNLPKADNSPVTKIVNSEFVAKLNDVNKCLANIEKLEMNKNPIALLVKPKIPVSQEALIINNIFQAIENSRIDN